VGPTFGLILEPGLHSFVGFFSNLRIALFVGRREYAYVYGYTSAISVPVRMHGVWD
jgi:hypothetical protein